MAKPTLVAEEASASLVVPALPRVVQKLPILAPAQLLSHELDGGGGGLRLLCEGGNDCFQLTNPLHSSFKLFRYFLLNFGLLLRYG